MDERARPIALLPQADLGLRLWKRERVMRARQERALFISSSD